MSLLERNGDPLLPSLRVLHWSQPTPDDTSVLAIISPSLQRMTFHFTGRPYDAEDMFTPHREDNLRSLLQGVCSGAPFLEQLWVPGITHPDSLRPIAKFEKLLRINMKVDISDITVLAAPQSLMYKLSATPHLVALEFPRLQTLRVSGEDRTLESIIHLVSVVKAPVLHTLSIRNDRCHYHQHWYSCLQLVSSVFGQILHRVSLHGGCSIGCNGSTLWDVVEPLTDTHALEDIKIMFKLGFISSFLRESDQHLLSAEPVWPKLIAFDFRQVFHTQWLDPIILAHIPRLAPNLKRLSISDVRFDSWGSMSITSGAHFGLAALNLGRGSRMRIKDPLPVARFIDALFPDLSLFRALAEESAQPSESLRFSPELISLDPVKYKDSEWTWSSWKTVLILLAVYQWDRRRGH